MRGLSVGGRIHGADEFCNVGCSRMLHIGAWKCPEFSREYESVIFYRLARLLLDRRSVKIDVLDNGRFHRISGEFFGDSVDQCPLEPE